MSQKININALCLKEINILNVCWGLLCFHLNPMIGYHVSWELTYVSILRRSLNAQFPHSVTVILVSHSLSAMSPPPKQLEVIRNSSPFNLPNLCQDCYQRAKQLLAVCPAGLSCTGRRHWVFSPHDRFWVSDFLLDFILTSIDDFYCFIS